MKNMNIGTRLVCGFLSVSLLALALCFFGLHAIKSINADMSGVGRYALPYAVGLGEIKANLYFVNSIQRTLLNRNLDDFAKKRSFESLNKARERYQQAIKEIEGLAMDQGESERFKDFTRKLYAWRTSNNEFFALVDKGDFEKMEELTLYSGRELREAALGALDELIATQRLSSTRLVADAEGKAQSSALWMQLAMAGGFILSIGLGLLLTRGIVGPLRKAVQMADGLAKGDLSSRMALGGADEVGQLARSLDTMADTLSRLNAGIIATADKASSGFLRSSIDDAGFEGEYKALISSINRWAKNVLMLIDQVPSPIMIRDKDRNMRFLNAKGGLGVVDVERLDGLTCRNHFKTEDCDNGRCACDAAFKSRREEASSTVARPLPDVELDIEYNAIPFGEDAVFEFVTDHTAIMKAQRKVVDIASQADQVALQVASATDQISAQVEQCSQGAQEQSNRVGETATAMEQMNATVLEVARNASKAADMAVTTKRKAEGGATIVKKVLDGISEVQKQAMDLKGNMASLGRQAEAIGRIMGVISDIADQTNLLALNAAIEAARAGDAGRGFAVVADEVRKLAEKTMAATREVGDAIHGIQNGTRENIANVERTVATIDEATGLANESGESLTEIVALVDLTTDQVRSIAAASEQQSAASDEINRSIEEINRISLETSDAMRQSNLAVGELAGQSQVLSRLIEDMQA